MALIMRCLELFFLRHNPITCFLFGEAFFLHQALKKDEGDEIHEIFRPTAEKWPRAYGMALLN